MTQNTSSEFRQRRRALGMSQRAVAERLGVTPMSISYIERGVQLSGRVYHNLTKLLMDLERERER